MSRLRKLATEDVDSYFKGLGFKVTETGGNCKAYEYSKPDGSYFWVTDDSGIDLPKSNDEEVIVCYYDKTGEIEGEFSYSDLNKLKADIPTIMNPTENPLK